VGLEASRLNRAGSARCLSGLTRPTSARPNRSRAAFAMPSDVALAGVPEPVGSGTAFSPALGSDSACGAGVGPTGLMGSHRDRLRRQRRGYGLGPARLIREDSLTACIMLLHPTPYSGGTLRFVREKTRLELGQSECERLKSDSLPAKGTRLCP
jgi:hypothetical protein